FGTFGVTSVASWGAGLLQLCPLLTSTLHYGLFEDRGRIEVRVSWDHRVTDGVTMARVLVDLEAVLNREVVRELTPSYRFAAGLRGGGVGGAEDQGAASTPRRCGAWSRRAPIEDGPPAGKPLVAWRTVRSSSVM